jgi:hypothetical protein
MKNHLLYEKLKQTALDDNYTIEQVQGLDFNAAAELFGTRSFSNTFFGNMKLELIAEMQNQQDESDKQLFQAKVESLRNQFPDFEVERGRQDNKLYVTIWPKGKPEIVREDSQGE